MRNSIIRQKLYSIVKQVYLNGEKQLSQDKQMKMAHIHRVEHTALMLAEKSNEVIDYELLSMGAIMHDIAKYIDEPRHNALGRILTKFLLEDMFDEETLDKIANLVLTHNCKNGSELNLTMEQKLLIDADIIDKLNLMRLTNVIYTYENKEDIIEEFYKILDKANNRKENLCTDIGRYYFQKSFQNAENFINNYKDQYK